MLLDSKPLTIRSSRDALREGIATVFQESSLIPALTAEENLLFGRLPIGWHRRIRVTTLHRQYESILESCGVRHLPATALVRDLSLEDRQLLEVVKAVSVEPKILILDEATAALGPEDTQWVLHQARAAAGRGTVVLFVSHRIWEVRAVSDRVTVLRGGRTVLSASIDEVDDDELITAMLGHRLEEQYPSRKQHRANDVVLQVEGLAVGRSCGPVSFQLHRGEILGVFALPGQGQRGLLMSIAGALRPEGSMTLLGRRYAPKSPADAQQEGVFLLPEDRVREALFFEHTCLLNVMISHTERRRALRFLIDRRAEKQSATATVDRIGLEARRLPDIVSTLSGGNQQKVVIARALLVKPHVFVLYDSTRGVDVGTKADIYRLIISLADEGLSVLFYSTDVTETLHLCDRVLVLEGGQIVGNVLSSDVDEETLLGLAVAKVSVADMEDEDYEVETARS
jgi:ABC-type sugar transport system ATPase subunit